MLVLFGVGRFLVRGRDVRRRLGTGEGTVSVGIAPKRRDEAEE